MPDITGANAQFLLSITTLFPAPTPLQGFAADDIFDTEPLESVETMMGVDGYLSAGFVYVPVRQAIALQADSPSISLFDYWWGTMQATRQTYFANAAVVLPALGKKYAMVNGVLTSYKPIPDTKKLLQPQRFSITWESVSPAVS